MAPNSFRFVTILKSTQWVKPDAMVGSVWERSTPEQSASRLFDASAFAGESTLFPSGPQRWVVKLPESEAKSAARWFLVRWKSPESPAKFLLTNFWGYHILWSIF
jgi:hypothetical protein